VEKAQEAHRFLHDEYNLKKKIAGILLFMLTKQVLLVI